MSIGVREWWSKKKDAVRAFLYTRQFSYRQTFASPYGQRVLADLAQFCRAHESTFHPDARMAAMLDGRREVFLRIQQQMHLSPDQLYELAVGQAESDKRILTIDEG